ncbi:hypothetical protein CCHL11_08226 [Colletotrichum chlorophyti]|uniref:Uncharacterized protein n=1 Tax=Colletotrichum chlorophyti TaxID=708187 RepID=A0A1Q8RJH1_9PEZI|nr:hypothetical protein CCHL11_08226 [Colletotrichum chlorophyti]
MGKKPYEADSDSDREDGGAKLNTHTDEVVKPADAMDVDIPPTPADKKKAAADARAQRALRRKQIREGLAAQGGINSASMDSTPNPEPQPVSPTKTKANQDKKPRKKRADKKSPEKVEKVEVETEPTTGESATEPAVEPAAETAPVPATVAETYPAVATNTTATSVADESTSNAPSSVAGGDAQSQGLNRAARRRLMQIERQRGIIKTSLGIAADSDERQAEVEAELAAWTANFDSKAEARALKKLAKKQSQLSQRKSNTGKLLTGRNESDEKQKQIKKQKQKQALRARQEGSSGQS